MTSASRVVRAMRVLVPTGGLVAPAGEDDTDVLFDVRSQRPEAWVFETKSSARAVGRLDPRSSRGRPLG